LHAEPPNARLSCTTRTFIRKTLPFCKRELRKFCTNYSFKRFIFSPLGINLAPLNREQLNITRDVAGVIVQYPNTEGLIYDLEGLVDEVHNQGVSLQLIHS
jgi:hypothetical protein